MKTNLCQVYNAVIFYRVKIQIDIRFRLISFFRSLRNLDYDWIDLLTSFMRDKFDFISFLDYIDWISNETNIIINEKKIEYTDLKIHMFLYTMLLQEKYDYIIEYANYIINTFKEVKNDREKYSLILVNLALAYKFLQKDEKAKSVIDNEDFDDSKSNFKLAKLIITNKYDDAIDMLLNDKEVKSYIDIDCLHEWPLFKFLFSHPKFNQIMKKYKKTGSSDIITIKKKA